MSEQRRVKRFRNGRSQAVRIPREFELSGEEAILPKEGERLIIEPTCWTRTPCESNVPAQARGADRLVTSYP